MITADMVKPGAAVLDVGVTRVEAGLVGDIDPGRARRRGVGRRRTPAASGPMTRAMLLSNIVSVAEQSLSRA